MFHSIMSGERQPGEVRITDHFDDEAIVIDKLVYLALHYRVKAIWEKDNQEKGIITKIAYLNEVFERFLKECENEDIQSFEAYDYLHKIHYRSKDRVTELNTMIKKDYLEFEYDTLFKKTEEKILEFS